MKTKATQIVARKTFDGKAVQVWTDGAVTTGQMATYVRGCGLSKSDEGRTLDVQAGLLLAGEVTLYNATELPAMVKAARAAVRKFADNADRLAAFRKAMNPKPTTCKRGCKCARCIIRHQTEGCRSVHCHTCGF